MTAGTACVLWLAEKITMKGIGNGTSMFIVAGIVASFPAMINELLGLYVTNPEGNSVGDIFVFFGVLLILMLIIVGIVFMEAAQKDSDSVCESSGGSPIPGPERIKHSINNSASVIPVIFASTLMSLPTTVVNFLEQTTVTYWIRQIFDYTGTNRFCGLHHTDICILVLLFVLADESGKDCREPAETNAYVPGIRPGAKPHLISPAFSLNHRHRRDLSFDCRLRSDRSGVHL